MQILFGSMLRHHLLSHLARRARRRSINDTERPTCRASVRDDDRCDICELQFGVPRDYFDRQVEILECVAEAGAACG